MAGRAVTIFPPNDRIPTTKPKQGTQNAHCPLLFAGLILSTSKSSSSRLYNAIAFAFASILPPNDNLIRDADTLLPVCCRMRSRRVDTSKLSGRSGIVIVEPSSFHSGFEGSMGSSIWREMGCCAVRRISECHKRADRQLTRCIAIQSASGYNCPPGNLFTFCFFASGMSSPPSIISSAPLTTPAIAPGPPAAARAAILAGCMPGAAGGGGWYPKGWGASRP
jgi:hypothetical protein